MKNFNLKKYKIFLLALLLAFYVTVPSYVEAVGSSKVYFKPSAQKFSPGSEFSVSVFVDSEDSVNAIDLEVSYSSAVVQFIDSETNGSIVSFWQSGGVFVSNGRLNLAGGIFPSFKGNGGFVSTLHFRAISAGDAKFSFQKSNLYIADGKGTQFSANTSPMTLSVNSNAPKVELPIIPELVINSNADIKDTTPPSITIRTIKDPVLGNRIIVFKAEDAESGIKSVEMRAKEWGAWSDWYTIENPTPYPEGAEALEVRVINNQGLEFTKSLSEIRTFPKLFTIIIVIVVTFILILVYNKRRHMPKL
jgi:hypothetical protein